MFGSGLEKHANDFHVYDYIDSHQLTHIGDGTGNHAVIHGAPFTPKFYVLAQRADNYGLLVGFANGQIMGANGGSTKTYFVTVPDATNIYIGSTGGAWGNDNGITVDIIVFG